VAAAITETKKNPGETAIPKIGEMIKRKDGKLPNR